MTKKLLIIVGCTSLLLMGCSSPKGGTNEAAVEQQNQDELQQSQSMVLTNEGVTPAPMSTPTMPAGRNPRDLRDPQATTIPGPPLGPRP